MKKTFFTPEAELILLDPHDIIRNSGDNGLEIRDEDDDPGYGGMIPLS